MKRTTNQVGMMILTVVALQRPNVSLENTPVKGVRVTVWRTDEKEVLRIIIVFIKFGWMEWCRRRQVGHVDLLFLLSFYTLSRKLKERFYKE